ncbi:MAG: translocation/assembly module TamB domain-containing protein [Nostoc sp. EfeVER01]|uniref:translocation/assembly module TamB domain-containing protein n=1 Tax=unclassified Nostoc TaxID=2593658 RepID=UPI002AD4B149|nr:MULTISPECIES: translocation/assembly module TamB domain-containing protein [unclassified Nostoc]MDZ7943565.1 translocation/assembly module TamB domain-containing protein [Nostoc sp. EfeVER01]MDZ7993507.1 translocation/assembly module TamB domain-containing protein [Nostoc sp. EspVER01]
MTRSPNSENNQEPSNRRLWLLLLGRTSLALGGVLLVGIIVGAWWARNYVYKDLAPLVQQNLEQLLGRPVKVGNVERFSLSSLRFSSLSIPATPSDQDRVVAKALEVQFSPLQLLLTRKLALNVTLIQPNVYVQQDKDGRWVTAQVKAGEGQSFIQTELQSLQIQDGNIELMPFAAPTKPKGSVILDRVGGIARFSDQNQRIGYDFNTQLTRGGAVKIVGETQLKAQQTNLQLSTQNLQASDITRLIQLPIALQAGYLNADLGVQIPPKLSDIAITGTATANQVTAKIQNLPQPVSNFNGKFLFQGQTVTLDNLSTNFGKVPILANGTINSQTGFNVSAQIKPVTAKNILDTLKVNSSVPASGEIQANIKILGALQQPVVSGTVSNTKPIQVDRVQFKTINTDFRLNASQTASQLTVSNLKIVPAAGGQIIGGGQANLGTKDGVIFNAQADGISGDILARSYGVTLPIAVGNVSAKAQISGSLRKQPLKLDVSNVQVTPPAGGQITANGQIQLAPQGQVGVDIQAQGIPGNAIAQGYGISTPINVGGISANAKITGSLGTPLNVNVSRVQANPDVGGQVTASGRVQLAPQGRVALNVQAKNIPGDAIAKAYNSSPSITIGNVSANADISGTLSNLQTVARVQAPSATYPTSGRVVVTKQGENIVFPDAVVNVAGGTITAQGQLAQQRWQGSVKTSQIQLSRFSPQLRGRLNSNIQVAGTTQSFQLADIRAAGQISLPQGVAQLAKPLTARFQWNGQQIIVENASTAGFNANGAIAIQSPPTGAPQITGFDLNVLAQNFNLQNTGFKVPGDVAIAGRLDFNGKVTGTPDVPQANGNIRLRNFNVSNLAFDPLLTGNVNFQGGQGGSLRLAGKQDRIALNLGADYRPTSFLVKRDEAVTTGRTEGDNLIINAQQFPIALVGGFLPNNQLKPLGGQLSGNLVVNLNNYAIAGDVAIAGPRVARVAADEFRGSINYADGTASLANGQLRIGDSNIALSGNVQAGNDPQFQFQANFAQAKIQRLLQAFNIFDFQDLSTGLQPPTLAGAEALETESISLPDADLKTQLAYFSNITAGIAKQQQVETKQTPSLPSLAELTGALNGAITANGSLKSGLNVGFNFQGANWQWGNYSINQVVAQGTFADGIVTLSPLSVGINQGLVAFSGQLGTDQVSGKLNVASLPLSLLEPFIEKYPVDITGNVNADATLAGSLQDPRVQGKVALANATLNKQPVQTGEVNFDYNKARLNFDSTLLVTGTQPVAITGSVPAPLPFAEVQPDSNQISINANVQNEGLALLNLLTNNQVAWVDGQGKVDLNVKGTLNEPIINGNATFNNATFSAQALSDPLTNVTGTALFNGSTVSVENIQGNYNQGQVTASGILPIFDAQQAAANPLTVSIADKLNFKLAGLYEGGVGGDVVIRGTALKPVIGGEIKLSDGKVIIGNSTTTAKKSAATTEANTKVINLDRQEANSNVTPTAENNTKPVATVDGSTKLVATADASTLPATPPNLPVEFADLKLILDKDIRVTTQSFLSFVPGGEALSQPLLSFDAKGGLTINGTLAKPLPQGVIRLTGGRLSLFSTEFTLARGYEQTARFTPSQGLDPTLDVRLTAIVPEASARNTQTLESPLSSEVSDVSVNNFGTLRSVRVQARVNGPASKLGENLELTSEPSRSKGEIVALLGGSILGSFGQADAGQGLTNFASSTILGSLQGTITAIGQAVGFSEFRIFPTPSTNEASRASILNLSAEGVFDINKNFSASLSRALSSNDSFRYNVLYRVNDEILMRGSTDLGDENQLQVEYETRF